MRNEKVNTLRVRTPEGVSFSFQLASPIARFLAWLLDFTVIVVVMNVLLIAASLLRFLSADWYGAAVSIVFFAVSIGYGIALEWGWRGQTIGKKLLRLRVMDETGLPLGFRQVVLRNLLRVIDKFPFFYLVGGIVSVLSPKSQRLGDLASGTIVVRESAVAAPDLDQLFGDKYNSLREHVHLQARIRQAVSPQEATIALQALLRRGAFTSEARLSLFSALAERFRSYVDLPEEVTLGLSDEQLVRNVVDVLFRNG